jgi:hypothetical protein
MNKPVAPPAAIRARNRPQKGDVRLFLWEKFADWRGRPASSCCARLVHGPQPTFDLHVPGRPDSLMECPGARGCDAGA